MILSTVSRSFRRPAQLATRVKYASFIAYLERKKAATAAAFAPMASNRKLMVASALAYDDIPRGLYAPGVVAHCSGSVAVVGVLAFGSTLPNIKFHTIFHTVSIFSFIPQFSLEFHSIPYLSSVVPFFTLLF